MPTLPITSANAVLILDVWYLPRRKVSCPSWLTGRFFSEVCFKHSFLVNVELNKSTLYATNFGSSFIMDSIRWAFFLGLLVRWLSGLSKTSLFLMFDVLDDRDDVFNATDNNNGDDTANKKSRIKKTQLMRWKKTERIRKPIKRCLWTDSVFLLDSSTLTYHSSFP